MTVLVPFSNASNIGLRRVPKTGRFRASFPSSPTAGAPSAPIGRCASSRTARRCKAVILLKAAEVFKSLLQLQIDKPLSFHEKEMLDRARHMLESEISTARNVPEVRAVNMLERALAKAGDRSAGAAVKVQNLPSRMQSPHVPPFHP